MGHPAMMPVPVLWVIANCVIVISLPALLCHAVLRRYWLACFATWILAFAAGFGVARVWDFPFNHITFGFSASLIGLATGMLLGIPFVLSRRGWFARLWTHLMNLDLPYNKHDPESLAAHLKELDRRRRQHVAAMLAFWFLAGIIASLATWFAQEPAHRDAAMLSGVVGLGLLIFLSGAMLTRLLFRTTSREAA